MRDRCTQIGSGPWRCYVAKRQWVPAVVSMNTTQSDGKYQGAVTAYCPGEGGAYQERCPSWVNTYINGR